MRPRILSILFLAAISLLLPQRRFSLSDETKGREPIARISGNSAEFAGRSDSVGNPTPAPGGYGPQLLDPLAGPLLGAEVKPFAVVEYEPGETAAGAAEECDCVSGANVVVLARRITPKVRITLRELQASVHSNPGVRGIFVLVGGNLGGALAELAAIARQQQLPDVVLSAYAGEDGPEGFRFRKESAGMVTSIRDGRIMSSVAFKRDSFCDVLSYSSFRTFINEENERKRQSAN